MKKRKQKPAHRDWNFRDFFEHSREGLALFDIQGRFIHANHAYCDMLGYTLKELLAKGDIHAITPAKWHDWQRREVWEKKLLPRDYSGVYVKEYIRKDGSVFPVQLSSFVVRDQQGEVSHLWCTARDITDQVRAENRLRESRERYRGMIENLMEGFYHARPDGTLLEYNPEFARILKLPPGRDHSGINLNDFWLNPGERETYLAQLLRDDQVRNYEIHGRTADGEPRVVRLNSRIVRDENGESLRIDGSIWDMTAEYRTQEDLRMSETRYRELFEHMLSGVAVYRTEDDGKDFIFVNFNAAAEKLENISREKLIGKPITRIFPGVREMGLLEVFQRVWRTGRSEKLPPTVYRDKEKTAWRENFVYKLPTGEIVAIYRDITGLKQTELNLLENKQRLVQAQRIAGMGDMVHDLETGEITWSEALYDLLQYDQEDPLSMDVLQEKLFHPDDRTSINRWLRESIESGNKNLPPIEYRLRRKDGSFISARTVGVIERRKEGKPRIYATVQDITERKRAETALETQYKRYATLLQNLKGMVYHCRNDRNWTMNFVSDGCLEVTGYLPRDLVENRTIAFNELILPEYRDSIWNLWQEKLARGESVETEYRIRRRDGRIRWVWERGRGIFDARGELSHLEGFIQDITERKDAEQELTKHRDHLEILVKEKTRELRERVAELERFHDATIDREIRMKELRDEIEILKKVKPDEAE